MSAQLIAATEQFVKDKLADDPTGHDWWHIARIRNTAKAIHAIEGGDWLTIDLALLLHDVGDYKVIGGDEDDYSIARNFLASQQVAPDTIDTIVFIIENMSFSKSLGKKQDNAPIEFYIVQDADRLDSIGAIGIARAFAYGGKKGRPLYDPTSTARDINDTATYRQGSGSTFHHFDEKLLHIKDSLNTDTAHAIAENRDAYMREFLEQFLGEWNGDR